MNTYNPNKKIKVEIRQVENAALGYEIYDVRDKDRSRLIKRDIDDNDVSEILTAEAYAQFQAGKSTFLVRSLLLVNRFYYFY